MKIDLLGKNLLSVSIHSRSRSDIDRAFHTVHESIPSVELTVAAFNQFFVAEIECPNIDVTDAVRSTLNRLAQ